MRREETSILDDLVRNDNMQEYEINLKKSKDSKIRD